MSHTNGKPEDVPPQHQEKQPGSEQEMSPEPDTIYPDYRGSRKLEGKTAIITGVIPDNTTRRIKNRLENEADPLRALQILRDEIPESVLEAQRKRRSERQKGRRKVILSAYLQAK